MDKKMLVVVRPATEKILRRLARQLKVPMSVLVAVGVERLEPAIRTGDVTAGALAVRVNPNARWTSGAGWHGQRKSA